jgi:hypothetical protein
MDRPEAHPAHCLDCSLQGRRSEYIHRERSSNAEQGRLSDGDPIGVGSWSAEIPIRQAKVLASWASRNVLDAAGADVYILDEHMADECCYRRKRDIWRDSQPGHRDLPIAIQACGNDTVDPHLASQQRVVGG